jgi:hypothetical protein
VALWLHVLQSGGANPVEVDVELGRNLAGLRERIWPALLATLFDDGKTGGEGRYGDQAD